MRIHRFAIGPALIELLLPPALLALAPVIGYPEVRAAYVYNYMPVDHVDSLSRHGFNRAILHLIPSRLDDQGRGEVRSWVRRGALFGVEVVPQWVHQSRERLVALATTRRYTPVAGHPDVSIPCPLDIPYWKDALIDRTAEATEAEPSVRSVALDLEIYDAGHKHYEAGPCRCSPCLREFTRAGGSASNLGGKDGPLARFQEKRLADQLFPILRSMRVRWPRLELGVFDLDLDSYVHRALARAIVRAGLRVTDYCEASYATGGEPLERARARLRLAGVGPIPIVGGLWLQRWKPSDLGPAVQSIRERADGYFIFTTYSLWREPAKLAGPYTLVGPQTDYWRAFREINAAP